MKPLMHGDLVAAGCALLGVPPACRQAHISTLLIRSRAADKYRKHYGKSHRDWGEGSLMSCARNYPQPLEPALCDPNYAQALSCVLQAAAPNLSSCTANAKLQGWVQFKPRL